MKAVVLPALKERLPLLRREKKMTQKQMAALMDCTEQHYQKIEYGQFCEKPAGVYHLS